MANTEVKPENPIIAPTTPISGFVSVVIPFWNRANTLPRAINSVLNQTYRNWELWLINDGSTDNSLEVIEPYAKNDERIHIVSIGPERSGRPAVPRNVALKRLKGDYVAFLDSDDEWLPNKLEIQLLHFLKNSETLAITTNANVITPDGNSNLAFNENPEITLETLFKYNPVITTSTIFRTKILKTIEYFPESMSLKGIEDYAYWLRIAALGTFEYLSTPLVKYYDDAAVSVRGEVKKSEWVKFYSVFWDFLIWQLRKRFNVVLLLKTKLKLFKLLGRILAERFGKK